MHPKMAWHQTSLFPNGVAPNQPIPDAARDVMHNGSSGAACVTPQLMPTMLWNGVPLIRESATIEPTQCDQD